MELLHGASITLKISKNELEVRKLRPLEVRGVIFTKEFEPNSSWAIFDPLKNP
jgi:hypothetical protein